MAARVQARDTGRFFQQAAALLRPLLDNGLKLDSRSINDALPIDRPFPVFTTTYCDADVRVSRDVDDNLYVYTKESDDTSLTSYDDVDADLGIPELIRGALGVMTGSLNNLSLIHI